MAIPRQYGDHGGMRTADSMPLDSATARWVMADGSPAGGRIPGVAIGRPWSLALRLDDGSGAWAGVIASIGSSGEPPALRLVAVRGDGIHVLRCELRTDFRPAPLTLTAPFSAIGTGAHEVVVRHHGPRIELLVDGVLLDEEWPAGRTLQGADPGLSLAGGDGETAFTGLVIRWAAWDRALDDGEVATLAGGADLVARRRLEILGPPRPFGQYWTPPGDHTGVGDCMPFFHEGRFHLFHLIDRHGHRSKWGLGAHQWAHVSTTDLRHWEHHPLAIAIDEDWEGSICTGSVFHHDGVFHAFYATRTNDGSPAPLQVATSRDGIHFAKRATLGYLALPYQPGPARDPVVFHDAADGLFHMLVTSELATPVVAGHGGCLAHLTSPDLARWTQAPPFLVPGHTDQPECPDHFAWRGWHYLVFSNNGVARYRMSRSPQGPWRRPFHDAFDGPRLCVLKTAAFTGDRRLGAAFLGHDGYGGEVVFRELVQAADGSLGTAFPPEMAPPAGPVLPLSWSALGEGATVAGDVCRLASDGFAALAVDGVPSDARITMRLDPAAGTGAFGVCLRGTGAYRDGWELRIDPARGKMGWRRAQADSIGEGERDAIWGVTALDRPFTLEIIACGRCIDVCIDGRRTLATVVPAGLTGGRLFLFAHAAEVAFHAVGVQPLLR
jgi:hypothetical protein